MAYKFGRRLLYGAGAFGLGTAGLVAYQNWSAVSAPDGLAPRAPQVFNPTAEVPLRATQLATLRHGTRENPFDVLIIGGGATGTGCAVDAVSRWVKPHASMASTGSMPLHEKLIGPFCGPALSTYCHDLGSDRPAQLVAAARMHHRLIGMTLLPCRGLRTALVEQQDFASGTSSRSTKLVCCCVAHGLVRHDS